MTMQSAPGIFPSDWAESIRKTIYLLVEAHNEYAEAARRLGNYNPHLTIREHRSSHDLTQMQSS